MKFFIKGFFKTVQAGVFIFSMQVDNDVLYCGIANQPSHMYREIVNQFSHEYSFLYLSAFLSFHTFE